MQPAKPSWGLRLPSRPPRAPPPCRAAPLALHQVTGQFLSASLCLDRYLQYVPRHINLPVLTMLAEKDRIIDNNPTRRFIHRFAAADKQIVEYPGAHHTLEFEREPD